MTQAPCMNCDSRRAACHDHCEAYRAWAEARRRENQGINPYAELDAHVKEAVRQRRKEKHWR